MTGELAVGDVVTVLASGDVGEVESVESHGAFGVRIVQEDSAWYRQLVYMNRGQLEKVRGF